MTRSHGTAQHAAMRRAVLENSELGRHLTTARSCCEMRAENDQVGLAKSVLVVVDVHNGFVSSKSAPVVPHVAGVVSSWGRAGGATLFTRFVNHPGSLCERLINSSRMQTYPTSTSEWTSAGLEKRSYAALV
ncbi:hypothetical protein PV646_37710 [Streptomyces sp. ID05-26A]|nr:hypothetical protein [Streptomyces sp. ID05-26A]